MNKLFEEAGYSGTPAPAPAGGSGTSGYSDVPEKKDEDLIDFYAAVGLSEEKVLKIVLGLVNEFKEKRGKMIPDLNNMPTKNFERFKKYFIQYLTDSTRIANSSETKEVEKLIIKVRNNGPTVLNKDEKIKLAKYLGAMGNQRMTYSDADVTKLLDALYEYLKTNPSSIPYI